MPQLVPLVLGGGIAAQLIGAGVSLAASFGLSYYQKRRLKKLQRQQKQDIQQNFRQATAPRYYIIGLARVGGLLAQAESKDTKMYVVPIISDDAITKVEAFYVRNIEVLTSKTGDIYSVTTPPFNTTSGTYIKFDVKFGLTDQTASSLLMSAFPSAYTANDNGAGISYIVAEITQPPSDKFQTVMGGGVPEIAALVRGVTCYDPRVPGANVNTPSTWVATTNPALHVLRYLIAANGMGLNPIIFNMDSFAAVADWCDDLVQTKTKGLRKRYECGGPVYYDAQPADVIESILETFAGDFYIDENGQISLSCDDLDAPIITITADMVVEIQADRYVGALFEATSVKSRFSSEDHGYADSQEEADQWDDEATIDVVGRVIPADHDLPFVFRHDQARRLMKRKWHSINPEWKIEIVTDFNGLELYGERVFRFEYPIFGISSDFRIESLEVADGLGRVTVRAVSISDASKQWDYLTEEGTAPTIPVATSEDAAPSTPAGLTGIYTATTANFRWNPLGTGRTAEAQYKLTSDTDWTTVSPAPAKNYATITGLTSATDYDFRVRSTNPDIGTSSWATITFNTTATAGSVGSLVSLSVTGGVLKGAATVAQSSSAVSVKVELKAMPTGIPINWSGSTIVSAFPGETVTTDVTVGNAGGYQLYARSIAADGTTGSALGPLSFTATATVATSGSSGTSGLGGFGNTINSDNHPLYGGSGFNGSYHPLYGGGGSSGSGSSGGGSIY